MIWNAIFTPEGIPRWHGPKPVEGSEEFKLPEGLEDPIVFLASHRRVGDIWTLRDPVKVVEPSAEDVAAERAADLQAQTEAEAQRLEAIEMEIVRLSGPDQLLRSMGRITIAELNLRVAAIRARVEAG